MNTTGINPSAIAYCRGNSVMLLEIEQAKFSAREMYFRALEHASNQNNMHVIYIKVVMSGIPKWDPKP